MKHFTIKQLTYSETAVKHRLSNVPDARAIEALIYLTENILDVAMDHFKRPIRINSGYRCPVLNKLVGGVHDSQHMYGEACDIELYPYDRPSNILLFNYIINILHYDQCISFRDFSYIHVSLIEPKVNRLESDIS